MSLLFNIVLKVLIRATGQEIKNNKNIFKLGNKEHFLFSEEMIFKTIYLAGPGPTFSMWDLEFSRVGSSSLTRD